MKPRNWSNDMITPVGRIPWNVQDREKRTIIFRLENRISSSCSLPFVYIFVISRYFNFSRSSGRGIKRKLGRGLQQQQQGWRIYANRSIILIPVALLHIQDSRCVQEKKQNNWLLAPNKESNKNQFFLFFPPKFCMQISEWGVVDFLSSPFPGIYIYIFHLKHN
jgi:hypothetical protein